ncbi:MAG: twin-arginine translocase subunit TatC [Micromonosporaceae bacterium]|nr:twin-arginine translocase subunit TatC [Micromonosporaceae bacterium]
MSPLKRRRPSNFQRAADGSMTLIEHIYELRNRLAKACLAIVVGTVIAYFFADQVQAFVLRPYCDYALAHSVTQECRMNATGVLDAFMLQLKIALYLGLAISAPLWLYQLWAFVAPGLHRHERRYTYAFAAVATPLFLAGMWLGFELVSRSIPIFLGLTPDLQLTLDITGYFDFVTLVMVVFGLGLELPLLVLMLNFAGVLSARRMLSWWRPAVLLMFLFAALVTPTPDPFGMTILAVAIAALYFAAVGVAFLNDARRAKRAAREAVADDEASPIEPVSPVDAPLWGVHGDPDSERHQ